jgi:hypothetical protein
MLECFALQRQDLFPFRIEVDAAFLFVRDVSKMRGLRGAMSD